MSGLIDVGLDCAVERSQIAYVHAGSVQPPNYEEWVSGKPLCSIILINGKRFPGYLQAQEIIARINAHDEALRRASTADPGAYPRGYSAGYAAGKRAATRGEETEATDD